MARRLSANSKRCFIRKCWAVLFRCWRLRRTSTLRCRLSPASNSRASWTKAAEDAATILLKPGLSAAAKCSEMLSMFAWLSKWPLVRQIRQRKDGTGLEAMSETTRAMHARIDDAEVARSICPYCGVGCGQLIFHKDGKLVSIDGDPESPISQGNLCPKGAASFQLLTHNRRETKMKYRAPRAKEWTEISLERAMEMVAERVWDSRKRTFVRFAAANPSGGGQIDGSNVNHTTAICHLGGATLA